MVADFGRNVRNVSFFILDCEACCEVEVDSSASTRSGVITACKAAALPLRCTQTDAKPYRTLHPLATFPKF